MENHSKFQIFKIQFITNLLLPNHVMSLESTVYIFLKSSVKNSNNFQKEKKNSNINTLSILLILESNMREKVILYLLDTPLWTKTKKKKSSVLQ